MKRRQPRNRWRGLETEAVHPGAARLDQAGVPRIVALMQSDDARVLAALRAARPAIIEASRLVRETYLSGGTCLLIGAGTSGRLAVLEAAELPPTFGTDPRRVRAVIAGGPRAVFRAREGAEDRDDEGRDSTSRVKAGDLVIGISASSVTPFVRGALEEATRRGAKTVLVTASRRSPLSARLARVAIRLDVGPEIVSGSTRLKAGTATKLALNQITTSAFASAGRVFGPWMVDLKTGSAKLRDRSRRILGAAAGCSEREAASLLARADGELKSAILMGRTGASHAEAKARLDRSAGDLRRALALTVEPKVVVRRKRRKFLAG